jgi:peptide/nickel transport system substrate-binding protein
MLSRRTIIPAMALLLVLGLIASCGGDDSQGSTTVAGSSTSVGQTTTTGGTETTSTTGATGATTRLVVGAVPPSTECNNPNRDCQPQDEYQLKPMYENLIGSNPVTGAWEPMLAESWSMEPDGRSIRFILRQNVQFHNGLGEFTAADVEFSLNDLIEPAGSVSGVADVMRSVVESVEIVNDHEIIFHNTVTTWEFFEGLGYGANGMAIKSKADAEARGTSSPPLDQPPIAGTGPYQFKERILGQGIVFEAVPYEHWRIQPAFTELEFKYIPENSTRLAALLAGEIQLTQLATDLELEANANGMVSIKSAVPGRRTGINFLGSYLADTDLTDGIQSDAMLYPDSPMNDPVVRRAINKAIDRDALNTAFFGGACVKEISWYWLPEAAGWNPDWETSFDEMYGYDPEAAKALLAEAGYGPDGETLNVEILATVDQVESADVMEAVAGMLTDVGIDAPITTMDKQQHREKRESLLFQSALEFDDTRSENITGFRNQGAVVELNGRGRAVEIPLIYEMYQATINEIRPAEQEVLWRDLGDVVFQSFQAVPLVRCYATVSADPNIVGGYTFPGAMVTADWTHLEYVTPAGS